MNIILSAEKTNSVDVIEVVKEGFELFQKSPVKLCLLALVSFFVSFFSIGILGGLMIMNFVAVVKRLDSAIPGSYDPDVSELFTRFDRFVDTFVLGLIVTGVHLVLFVLTYILGISDSIVGMILVYAITLPLWLLAFQIMDEEEGANAIEIFLTVVNYAKESYVKVLSLGAVLSVIFSISSILWWGLSFLVTLFTLPIVLTSGRVYFKKVK